MNHIQEAADILPDQRFSLGHIFIVPQVTDKRDAREIIKLLIRHVAEDWGDVTEECEKANNIALASGGKRLFSAYRISERSYWIVVTNPLRTETTIVRLEW